MGTFPALLLSLAPTLAPAQAPAPAPDSTAAGGLEAALETVTVAELSADLHFLAADELGGRDSPSLGLEIAALYLRARLQRLGFQPGDRDGYFYEYALPFHQADFEASGLSARAGGRSEEFELGRDYFLPRASELADWILEGELADAGTGSQEDLAGLELSGRWALVREGGGTFRRVSEQIAAAGAVGMVWVGEEGSSGDERWVRETARLREGALGGRRRGGGDSTPFPKVAMTRAAAERLLALAGGRVDGARGTTGITLVERRAALAPAGRIFLKNVVGLWPGSDPELAREVFILSAHYDHVGTSGGEIFNGADDNASGTTGLLGIAEALAAYGPMKRSVLLMWVSAEEKGLIGSRAWTQRPWLPEGHYPIANINIDMIGRNRPDDLMITPTEAIGEHYNALSRIAGELRREEGFGEFRSADAYWRRSDQVNFAENLDLPVAFLFADVHEDYHGPHDHADKIEYDKLRRVVRLVVRMLDAMQGPELVLHQRPIPSLEDFRAKVTAADALRDLEYVRVAAHRYASMNGGHWPASVDELLARDASGSAYLAAEHGSDPWGARYVLRPAEGGGEPAYLSLGADRAPGGEGEAADLVLE